MATQNTLSTCYSKMSLLLVVATFLARSISSSASLASVFSSPRAPSRSSRFRPKSQFPPPFYSSPRSFSRVCSRTSRVSTGLFLSSVEFWTRFYGLRLFFLPFVCVTKATRSRGIGLSLWKFPCAGSARMWVSRVERCLGWTFSRAKDEKNRRNANTRMRFLLVSARERALFFAVLSFRAEYTRR